MTHNQHGGIIFKFLFLFTFVLALTALYLVWHPLLRIAGDFWVVEDPLKHADVIMVIGDDDFAGSRASRAAELFHAGWAPRVVASGSKLRPYASAAEFIARDLENRGVPTAALLRFDHDAENTHDEALALRNLAAEENWRSILLVTSNYHTRRARYIFRKIFPARVVLAVVPAPDPAFDPGSWWTTRAGGKIFFLESVGYCVAWWELRRPLP